MFVGIPIAVLLPIAWFAIAGLQARRGRQEKIQAWPGDHRSADRREKGRAGHYHYAGDAGFLDCGSPGSASDVTIIALFTLSATSFCQALRC